MGKLPSRDFTRPLGFGGDEGTRKGLKGLLHGEEMSTMRQDADGVDICMAWSRFT